MVCPNYRTGISRLPVSLNLDIYRPITPAMKQSPISAFRASLALFLSLFVAYSAIAQTPIIPMNVSRKFDEKHVGASTYYWEAFNREYLVYYEMDDNFYYARLNLKGEFLEEGTSLDKPFPVPAPVLKTFSKETNETVPLSEAFKGKTLLDGEVVYFLVGFTLKTKYEILVAENGTLIRHEEGLIETVDVSDEDDDEDSAPTPDDQDDKADENERDPRHEDGEGGVRFRDPRKQDE